MKRLLTLLLCAALLVCSAALAEDDMLFPDEDFTLELGRVVVSEEPTHITVCNSTKVNGAFFSHQFGNNTSDIDVRAMLHGYNPIVWTTQLEYILDPMVVEEMVKTEGNQSTLYTFTIYDDLCWNDGSPITAADYVFGYVLQASKEFQAISGDTDVWQHVVGYEAFASGESDVFKGIRLLGDYQFSIEVKNEYLPYFYEYSYLYIMPSPIGILAPGCEVADDGKGAYIRNIDSEIEEPLYTAELLNKTILDPKTGYLSYPYLTCGPYNLVSYDPVSGTVEFTLNEYYKGNYEGVKPVINDITLIPALPQDMAQMLADGEVDLINKAVDGQTINDCMELTTGGEFTFENYTRLGYGYIGLACEQGPQQFVKVRQAICYAFDTNDFVDKFLMGYGMPVYGYYGIGQWMTQVAMGALRPADLPAEKEEIWDSFNLDELNTYDYNPDKALELLIEDGWVLNRDGNEYDPETDTVRYKLIENEDGTTSLMALSFDFGLTIDNNAAHDVLNRLQTVLEPMGVEFVVHDVAFTDLLIDFMREEGTRVYDMEFMAHNFVSIFDPLVELASEEEVPGSQNGTGVYDEELIARCWDMHLTQPGDCESYEAKWIEFQKRFNEILPTVPIYSNIYFDFHSVCLQNYHPDAEANWPRAIIYAFWTEQELPEEEPEFTDEEEPDDDMMFLD